MPELTRFFNLSRLLMIAACLTGCNTLTLHFPASRFDPPEVPGATWKKHLGFGLSSTHDVIAVSDASSRPPDLGTPTATQGTEAPVKFALGFWESIELEFRAGLLAVPFVASIKYQFLGDPMIKSHAQNFSLAATAGAGTGGSTNSGSQNGTFGPGGYPWNANANTTMSDFALIGGYRFSDSALLYGGPFYSRYNMDGNVHQDKSDNGLSPAGDYHISGNGQQSGFNLALQLNPSPKGVFSLTAEIAYSVFLWNNSNAVQGSDRSVQGGLLLDWFW